MSILDAHADPAVPDAIRALATARNAVILADRRRRDPLLRGALHGRNRGHPAAAEDRRLPELADIGGDIASAVARARQIAMPGTSVEGECDFFTVVAVAVVAGVDRRPVRALTHSASALDLERDFDGL